MTLLLEEELVLLLFLGLVLELHRDSLFDELEHQGAALDHLLVDNVDTSHLHVGVSLICLLVL